jgi:hypothetical protein
MPRVLVSINGRIQITLSGQLEQVQALMMVACEAHEASTRHSSASAVLTVANGRSGDDRRDGIRRE